ncbi:hypothetical protein SAMN02745119_00222 [Trichlorobacter thiogenes]|uniref:Uncharacterized protein n=1 Tax=Trichlorobacter thiogenes TaxID=115783 RepID=A0A1T4K002_9BACT|nr:hypothetical protein [Trichlorobacter thiogenes]SJZ35796.1 hypothetical protein SAMN02745119_00222 [Trichlorobacter thiogenes]
MQDKRDISQGVVYDFDEMQRACHQLRAIQLGIDGLGLQHRKYSDGSSPYEGLSFMLHDIIKWLAPDDAVTEDDRLEQKLLQQQIASATASKLKAA